MSHAEGFRILPESQVAIVGGTGIMGRVLTHLLIEMGYNVTLYSRSKEKAQKIAATMGVKAANLEDVSDEEILIVSVPIEVTRQVCLDIIERMKKGSLLVDVASVKTPLVKTISKDLPKGYEYISIHPLFGPSIRQFKGENLLAVKGIWGRKSDDFISHLMKFGLNVNIITAPEHDRIMAAYQVMHHYALLSLGVSLGEHLSFDDFDPKLYTRSFKVTLKTLKKVKRNLKTILEIQRFNPEAQSARRNLMEASSKLLVMDDKNTELLKKKLQFLDKI